MRRLTNLKKFGRRVTSRRKWRYRQSCYQTDSPSVVTPTDQRSKTGASFDQMAVDGSELANDCVTEQEGCQDASPRHPEGIVHYPKNPATCLPDSDSKSVRHPKSSTNSALQELPHHTRKPSKPRIATGHCRMTTAIAGTQTPTLQRAVVKCAMAEDDVAKIEIYLPLSHLGIASTRISHYGTKYTAEEKQLIKQLKERGQIWGKIYQEYNKVFPGRTKGSIKTHYYANMNQR